MTSAPGARSVCIHGHFYQPPRENPWTDEVERQASARPYHDWNERITAECYAPNAAARVLDASGALARVLGTYGWMSFDFGPTLLDWLARHDRETYAAVLAADRDSRARCSGHGGAMAQAYAHPILPLCHERDRETQVAWGLRDFAWRFGRRAEGMWLPETAVDIDTLETLARHGIGFTVLAPSQAEAWRPIGDGPFRPVGPDAGIDTRVAYRVALPSGRSLAVLFYDAGLSSAIAFGGLLSSGARLVEQLRAAFRAEDPAAQLVHVATDGETYGHHHAFGEMALAWALDRLAHEGEVRVTTYGEFLATHPPAREVRVRERTAWSCAHGLGRWREDCGCRIGAAPGYSQAWRGPLRESLDALRDELAACFEREGARIFEDPWAARDAYVDVVLDRSVETERVFLATHGRGDLGPTDRARARRLLEMQRHTLLMFASCAWFFDEVSGIETVQALRHAARAAELGEEVSGEPFAHRLVERLERVPSNRPAYGTARGVFEREVEPARVDPRRHVAHHAARVLFDVPEERECPAYRIVERARQRTVTGPARLVAGRVEIESRRTGELGRFAYAFLHAGGLDVTGIVHLDGEQGRDDARRVRAVATHLERGDAALARSELASCGTPETLGSLRPDVQHAIVRCVLDATIREVEQAHERVYREREALLGRLHDLGIPAPRLLVAAAELVLNARLRRELDAPDPDPGRVRELLEESERSGAALDGAAVGRSASGAVDRLLARVADDPLDEARTERVLALLALLARGPAHVDLSRAQVALYRIVESIRQRGAEPLPVGLTALAEALRVAVGPAEIARGA